MVIQLGTPEVKFHDKGHKSVFTNTGEINARKSFSACKFTLDAKKWSAENRPEMETVNVTKWSVWPRVRAWLVKYTDCCSRYRTRDFLQSQSLLVHRLSAWYCLVSALIRSRQLTSLFQFLRLLYMQLLISCYWSVCQQKLIHAWAVNHARLPSCSVGPAVATATDIHVDRPTFRLYQIQQEPHCLRSTMQTVNP